MHADYLDKIREANLFIIIPEIKKLLTWKKRKTRGSPSNVESRVRETK